VRVENGLISNERGKAREEMAAAGHDTIWAGDWPEDPGDEEILEEKP